MTSSPLCTVGKITKSRNTRKYSKASSLSLIALKGLPYYCFSLQREESNLSASYRRLSLCHQIWYHWFQILLIMHLRSLVSAWDTKVQWNLLDSLFYCSINSFTGPRKLQFSVYCINFLWKGFRHQCHLLHYCLLVTGSLDPSICPRLTSFGQHGYD